MAKVCAAKVYAIPRGMTWEDVVQEGVLLYLKNKQEFDKDPRDRDWNRCKWVQVWGDLRDMLRAQRRMLRAIQYANELEPESAEYTLDRADRTCYDNADDLFWHDTLKHVTPERRYVMTQVYRRGRSMTEVAAERGVSVVAVSQMVTKTLNHIRRSQKEAS